MRKFEPIYTEHDTNSPLRECPFCGKKPRLEVLDGGGYAEFFVICPKCHIEQGRTYRSSKTAINAWNRRKGE